jgi:uncharacterized protein
MVKKSIECAMSTHMDGTAVPTQSSLQRIDWRVTLRALDIHGYATLPGLISEAQCLELAAAEATEVTTLETLSGVGAGFCQGSVCMLVNPCAVVGYLEALLYPPLNLLANVWSERSGSSYRFPASPQALVTECAEWGQHRTLSYLSCYGVDDCERLHHCVRGEQRVFPFQAIVLLSRAEQDFVGGQLSITRQDERTPTASFSVQAQQGDVVLLAVKRKPRREAGELVWSTLRHAVQPVRSGQRKALNLVFHRGNGSDENFSPPERYPRTGPGVSLADFGAGIASQDIGVSHK